MKKIIMLAVAAAFSFSTAAYACDGMKAAKAEKSSQQTAKKETAKAEKKS